MSKSPTRRSPLPPTFSVLHAKQDAVLVCTKKDGTVENFDYITPDKVLVNGVPLGQLLEDMHGFLVEQFEYNKELEARMQAIEDRQLAFAQIFAPQGGTAQ